MTDALKLQRSPKMTDALKLEEAAESGLSRHDLLAPFREIAAECSERDCREILDDCDDPEIRQIYERRLKQLSARRIEVEHWENKFSKG